MILQQFFEPQSSTYTYLVASQQGGEAICIDPVESEIDHYLQFLGKHHLRLVKVFDTHTHADHISGMAALRNKTHCATMMGKESAAARVSIRLEDGETFLIDDLQFTALHTPGHTHDSYCLSIPGMVFTGDTLLIRGTGRTDFQQGDPHAQYQAIQQKLLTLPDDTIVYPGHDYKGENLSTIAREKHTNPRLQVPDADAYAELMSNLNLPKPSQMDVAIPANQSIGSDINTLIDQALVISVDKAIDLYNSHNAIFIDLRDANEIQRSGTIPGSLQIPFSSFDSILRQKNSPLLEALDGDKPVILFCAYGERSALALKLLQESGLKSAMHIGEGFHGWQLHQAPVVPAENIPH